ncbi:MAG TPA: methyltransferase [Allosphingosinicella sp.]
MQVAELARGASPWSHLFEIMNAYVRSTALFSANDLGLFDYLDGHPGASREQIAEGLGIPEFSARVLLMGICDTGMVERDPQTLGYRNSATADTLMVSGREGCMAPFVKFNSDMQAVCLRRMTESLREGRNAGLDLFDGPGDTLYQRISDKPELETLFQDALGAYSTWLLKALETVPEFGEVSNLLDVAGGDATTALHLARMHPRMKVRILETPTVCRHGEARLAEIAPDAPVSYVVGEAFENNWPKGSDGVLMSHFVEIFDLDQGLQLFRNAFSALEPGGRIFLWSATADPLETRGLQSSKSSLYFLAAASGGGMTFPASDHVAGLERAGFEIEALHEFEEIEHTCIIGRKPS